METIVRACVFKKICRYFYLYKFFRECLWSPPPYLKIRHIRLQNGIFINPVVLCDVFWDEAEVTTNAPLMIYISKSNSMLLHTELQIPIVYIRKGQI